MTSSDSLELRLEDLIRSVPAGRAILAETSAGGPSMRDPLDDVADRLAATSGATIVHFDRSGARELASVVRLTRAVLVLARPERTSLTRRVVRRTLAYYASRIDVPLATVDRTGRIEVVEPLVVPDPAGRPGLAGPATHGLTEATWP